MKTYYSNHKPVLSIILVLLTILSIQVTSYADITPVEDRTKEVRRKIVASVPGVNNAEDVTNEQLAAITHLNLGSAGIITLESGDFSGLSGLRTLRLNDNDLTSLPEGIFDELSELRTLLLFSNNLRSLPAGLFDGLTSLTTANFHWNDVEPLPMTVSLEKVADGEFKVKVDTGVPVNVLIPVSATNGSIDDDTTEITILKGKVESDDTYTVTRTGRRTDDVTVNIGRLPDINIQNAYAYRGLNLVKSSDLPLVVIPGEGNNAPVFTDGTDTTHTIAENSHAGLNIGTAVAATDADDDTLTYSLDGTDALSFDIDNSTGQLQTNAALDFETQSSYSVIVSVSDGNGGSASIDVTITVTDALDSIPLNERTSEVATAILDAISGVSVATDVTDTHLAAITTLDLSDKSISTLQIGDFSGLTTLETLNLSSNSLLSLPGDIFYGLSSLVTLNLSDNSLSSLPDGVFSGLTSLTNIDLQDNAVSPVPITVSLEKTGTGKFKAIMPTGALFDVVLPVSVTNGSISGGATNITISQGYLESDDTLTVRRTARTFPAVTVDIGAPLSIPTSHVGYSLVKSDGLPLTVIDRINRNPTFSDGNRTTRRVGENTDRGTNIGNPITATDPDTDNTLTYSLAGSDASAFRVESDTGQLKTHDALDYETKSSYFVRVTVSDGNGGSDSINVLITVTDIFESTPLSERTSEVATAIEDAVTDITDANLAAIPTLNLSNRSISSLQIGDFSGLTSLKTLNLRNNSLSSLPANVFKELGSLETLNLSNNSVSTLITLVFNRLGSLKTLNLSDNSLSRLSDGVFTPLDSLETLNLSNNSLRSISGHAFGRAGSSVVTLNVSNNSLVSIGSHLLDRFSSLETLNVSNNSLIILSSDLFDKLSSLKTLNLSNNSVNSLSSNPFDALSSLETLNLSDNSVRSLSSDVFNKLSSLKTLDLQNNLLEDDDMHDGLFSGLSSLNILLLADNTDAPFLFRPLPEKTSEGKFKAKLAIGAPYRMDLAVIKSDNATTPSGSHSKWLNKGETETAEFTVIRKPNSNASVSVNFRLLTPRPNNHNGYRVRNSTTPVQVISAVALAPTPLPEETSFLPNYPNPFNPETWIPYQLAKPMDVRLTIYDVRGVIIRTLALGHQPAGFYQSRERAAHWDGRNDFGEKVATGIYFCTFKAGDFTATRKMLILK